MFGGSRFLVHSLPRTQGTLLSSQHHPPPRNETSPVATQAHKVPLVGVGFRFTLLCTRFLSTPTRYIVRDFLFRHVRLAVGGFFASISGDLSNAPGPPINVRSVSLAPQTFSTRAARLPLPPIGSPCPLSPTSPTVCSLTPDGRTVEFRAKVT